MLVLVGPRALLTNELEFDKEPRENDRMRNLAGDVTVNPPCFWAMVRNLFGHMKEAHRLAISSAL